MEVFKGDVSLLSMEDIKDILDNERMIRAWLDDVHKFALEELKDGRQVPGYKLVPSSRGGARKWDFASDTAIIDFLRERKQAGGSKKLGYDLASRRVPLSPAQAEKQVKPLVTPLMWQKISEHIIPGEKKPVLAQDSDPRAPIVPEAGDVFQPVTTGLAFLE
jgi:hypothetical protein